MRSAFSSFLPKCRIAWLLQAQRIDSSSEEEDEGNQMTRALPGIPRQQQILQANGAALLNTQNPQISSKPPKGFRRTPQDPSKQFPKPAISKSATDSSKPEQAPQISSDALQKAKEGRTTQGPSRFLTGFGSFKPSIKSSTQKQWLFKFTKERGKLLAKAARPLEKPAACQNYTSRKQKLDNPSNSEKIQSQKRRL